MTRRDKTHGYVLILTLVMSAVFLTIGLSMGSLISARYQSSKRTTFVENAILAADAGVTDTLNTLTTQSSFTGYSTAKQLYSDDAKGKATYTTSVSYDAATKLYTITSTGNAYRAPGDPDPPTNTKKVEVTAALASSSLSARVAVGSGGLVVNGGNIGGQNIWVNGKVTVNNGNIGATGFGWVSSTSDSTLNVANFGCGDATNYPIKCTGPVPGTGEPVQIGAGGSIYGTVCGNDQVTSTNIYPGQGGLGLVASCKAPSVSMPTYDRQALFNSMTQTKTGFSCSGLYAWQGPPPPNLVGNTFYTSNITISDTFGGACGLSMITGNVYIRGDLTLGGFSTAFKVAENDVLGNPITTPPIIAVEGKILSGCDATWICNVIPNSRGVGAMFVSFNSNNATCNSSPACNSLSTVADRFNSVTRTTVTTAGGLRAVESGFYSYFGTTDIQGGSVGAVAGQRVMVESTGGVWSGFVQGGINNASFPSGDAFGGKVTIPVWNIISYRQTYS
jgi:hypothetical protein